MKLKKLFSSLVVVATAITLGGCGTGSTSSTPEPTSSVVTPSSVTPAQKIEYINDASAKLALDYKGHDFYKDGIGQVTLKSSIDGDTAHFTPVITDTSSETIKARFYGIDTPESTGKVQEWGKPASKFTKEKLTEANKNGTIVVSSAQDTYKIPNHDSTGERYVCIVWVSLDKKDADIQDLVMLNLWIVQEGYSYPKNVNDTPQYVDVFSKATDQAEKLQLCLYSPDPDETFNYGDYDDVSLLDIKREVVASLKDPNHVNKYDNQKVRITGTVAGYSNHILYLQSYFSKENGAETEDGEYAGINVFVGMSSPASKFTTKNTYIQLCGLAQDSENFGFQITSVYSFNVIGKNENDTQILIKPEDNTDEFELNTALYTTAGLGENNYDSLFCSVEITHEVEISGLYVASNDEITLYIKDSPVSIYVAFIYYGNPESPNEMWNSAEQFVGKKFKVRGIYTFHKGMSSGKVSWQINPSNKDDLVWVQ